MNTMNISSSSLGGQESSLTWEETFVQEKSDPRAANLPLMSSLWPTAAICLGYVVLVKLVGPWYMKDQKPFEIKRIIMTYNVLQTVFSGWACMEFIKLYIKPGGYSLLCQPVDYTSNPEAVRTLHIVYFVFLSKFADLFDSIFFVLRKKFTHLSALHVIHHSITPITFWWGTKFAGGGHTVFSPLFNCGIHTLMYFYYFLAACGPEVQKHLWWKKYLTSMQLIQFVSIFVHSLLPLYFSCDYPPFMTILCIGNAVLFFGLFSHFYKKSYSRKKAD